MEIFLDILLWLHFAGLVIGMGSGFSSGQVAMRMGGAPEDARPTLASIYSNLARLGHIGLGVLIVTGLLLAFLKYDIATIGIWFWIKMALVVVLIGLIAMGTRTSKRAQAGDAAAMALAPRLGMMSGITGFLIILAAVFEFH